MRLAGSGQRSVANSILQSQPRVTRQSVREFWTLAKSVQLSLLPAMPDGGRLFVDWCCLFRLVTGKTELSSCSPRFRSSETYVYTFGGERFPKLVSTDSFFQSRVADRSTPATIYEGSSAEAAGRYGGNEPGTHEFLS